MPPPLSHTGGALALAPLVGADKENQLPAVPSSGGSSLLHKPLLLHKPAGLSASNVTGTPLRAMMGLSKLGGGALRRPAAQAAAVPEEDDDDDELTAAVQAATAAAVTATPAVAAPTTTTSTSATPSTPAKSHHGSMLKLGGSHAHGHALQSHGTPKLTSTKPLHIGSSMAMPVRAASAISLPSSTVRAHSHTLVAAPIPSVAAVAASVATHSTPAATPSQPPAITVAPTPVVAAVPVAPVAVAAPTPVVAPATVVAAAPIPVAVVAPTPAPAAVPVVAAVPAPVVVPAAAPVVATPAVSKPVAAPAPASAPAAATVAPSSAASTSPILQSFTEVRTKHGFLLNGTEYSKLRTIGKGGSSLVYLVCSPSGQLFALKEMILPASESTAAEPAHVADYVTEVSNMLAMKGSPHVAQLHLALEQMSAPTKPAAADGEFEDAPPRSHATRVYMLMEAGVCDLDTHLTQVRSELAMTPFSVLLPSYTVRWLWAQMLRCIAAVHAKGIIHTDLKPVNFILGGERASLKLIDFGIAKHFDVDAGATSALNDKPVGTLNYMSPESLSENVRLRSSTDIWSAGCILYGWIYGEAPFARFHKLPAKMHAIANVREQIALPARIQIREEVLTQEQEKDKSFIKGTGLVVTIEAARPASRDGTQVAREASCSITKTYRRMPPHLEGLPLPHYSERCVGEEVRQVLRACLQRKPEERPTALQLLAHPYTAGGDEVGSASAAAAPSSADAAALTALQNELAAARAAQTSEAAARAALQTELASARAVQASEAAARAALQAELESLRASQEASARQAVESAARAAAESASRADMESRSRCVSLKSRLAFQAALLQLVDKVCRKSLEKAASARINYARPRRDNIE